MLKALLKNKIVQYTLLFLTFVLTLGLMFVIFDQKEVQGFFAVVENKSFDLRQSLVSESKRINDDIVIISIDDASYEFLLDKYGEWPIPREVYADVVKYLEKQSPSTIAFDLMFVKSLKSKIGSDKRLADEIANYDNIFVAMNFDNQTKELRDPPVLPEGIKAKIVNQSGVSLSNLRTEYLNCRAILPEILNSTDNIGHINLVREDDGISRKVPMFVFYRNDFYPHLAMMVAINYLNQKGGAALSLKDYKIDKSGNLVLGSRLIPLDRDGSAILNWYGESGRNEGSKNFKYIPFWQVVKAMNGEKSGLEDKFFKGKIIYLGTSAMSLYDIKSTPTERYLPGVELHATLVNNILDNNFIRKIPTYVDYGICIILWLVVAWIIYKNNSAMFTITLSVIIAISYCIIAVLLMNYYNIWVGMVMPLTSIISAVIVTYIIKYVLKSRDFEYTYKLATTDGLTELYNHRYFQEQMLMNIESAKRYNGHFSLILIDIDYFKKFNDKFGHQAGDAVLKQVAQVLKKSVRTTDIVCRYGGEEMAVILTNTDNDEAVITANKICTAVSSRSFRLPNAEEQAVTISLGVSTYPQNGDTSSVLIEYSDKCLYAAKESGRNRVGKIE